MSVHLKLMASFMAAISALGACLVTVFTPAPAWPHWQLGQAPALPRESPAAILQTGSWSPENNESVFVFGTVSEPDCVDPANSYSSAGWQVIQNAYETLVTFNGSSGEDLVPLLALEVPSFANGLIASDGLMYTFNLRAGILFHSGELMDASDVEYSIERVLRIHDPDGPSWMLEQIMNDYIQYYVGGPLSDFKNDSYGAQWVFDAIGGTADGYIITEQDVQNVSEAAVVMVDQDTVSFRLTHPYPGFLKIAASSVMSIVDKEYVEAHGGTVNGQHNNWMDTHMCGTGPFELSDWLPGVCLNLTRFPGYHGLEPAYASVVRLHVPDLSERHAMLLDGRVDAAEDTIWSESEFKDDPGVRVIKGEPTFEMSFAGFNMAINTTSAAMYGSDVPADFFTDKKVRQAFVSLMDYSDFIEQACLGNAIQPNGPIPKGMFGYNQSIPLYEYNLTKAAECLQNATNSLTGRTWWEDGFTVAFLYNAGNPERERASWSLRRAIESLNSMPGTHGVFLATVTTLDWPTYLSVVRARPSPLPLFWFGWVLDYADPDYYVSPFLCSHGALPSATRYVNETLDDLIVSAAAELNESRRYELYSQISALCYDDAPYIWLAQRCDFHVERAWMRGYYFNPARELDYSALYEYPNGQAPVASFSADPSTGTIFTEFVFNASSSYDPDDPNEPLMFRWDWESDGVWDTARSHDREATHMFSSCGVYTIRLEVCDMWGNAGRATAIVAVLNSAPCARIVCSPGLGDLSTVFEFDASTSSDLEDPPDSLVVRWDWDNDSAWDTPWSTTKVAYHQFAAPGVHTVRVEVMDTGTLSSVASVDVTVVEVIPEFGSMVAPVIIIAAAGMMASSVAARRRR